MRGGRLHAADGRAATGRFNERTGACWETSSHYQSVPAQCSALLKKYTESQTLDTLNSCICNNVSYLVNGDFYSVSGGRD